MSPTAREVQVQIRAINNFGVAMAEFSRRMTAALAAASISAEQALAPFIALARLQRQIKWELVVEDPFDARPSSPREFLRQARDIFLHEFWKASDEIERSPGARWHKIPPA